MTALSPIPDASAIGKFATTPMRIEQIAAAAAVAATAGANGTPAAERIAGVANRMYAIVRNVAPAPRTSAVTLDPRRAGSNGTRTGNWLLELVTGYLNPRDASS